MYDEPKFTLAGDQAVSVELGNEIDPAVNKRIHSLRRIMQERSIPGLRDLIPTYKSLLVQYDPITISLEDLQNIIVDAFGNLDEHSTDSSRVVLLHRAYRELDRDTCRYTKDVPQLCRKLSLLGCCRQEFARQAQ